MTKRGADKQLNYDNWDEPDETTECETFRRADPETIKSRPIIQAKRKSVQPPQTKLGLFKSFSDFADSNNDKVNCNDHAKEPNDAYLLSLSVLNKQFLAWVSKHVSEDPYCILTPVFSDYISYLDSLDKTPSDIVENKPSDSVKSTEAVHEFVPSLPNRIENVPISSDPPPQKNGEFSFKFTEGNASSSKPPSFNFGFSAAKNASAISTNPVFSFKSGTPELPEETQQLTADDENDEYIPPKPEVREIKEPGSAFTIRCKLFYKSMDNWTERGLGNLHLIPGENGKLQFLVRADTNLGNILLNILVTKDIPMHRQKNNLTFACVPYPPLPSDKASSGESSSPSRPTPMLIRVKNEEAAIGLLEAIDKYREKV